MMKMMTDYEWLSLWNKNYSKRSNYKTWAAKQKSELARKAEENLKKIRAFSSHRWHKGLQVLWKDTRGAFKIIMKWRVEKKETLVRCDTSEPLQKGYT